MAIWFASTKIAMIIRGGYSPELSYYYDMKKGGCQALPLDLSYLKLVFIADTVQIFYQTLKTPERSGVSTCEDVHSCTSFLRPGVNGEMGLSEKNQTCYSMRFKLMPLMIQNGRTRCLTCRKTSLNNAGTIVERIEVAIDCGSQVSSLSHISSSGKIMSSGEKFSGSYPGSKLIVR